MLSGRCRWPPPPPSAPRGLGLVGAAAAAKACARRDFLVPGAPGLPDFTAASGPRGEWATKLPLLSCLFSRVRSCVKGSYLTRVCLLLGRRRRRRWLVMGYSPHPWWISYSIAWRSVFEKFLLFQFRRQMENDLPKATGVEL